MKHFFRLLAGEFISNIGSGMTSFALSVYIYEKTGRVSYVSAIMLLAYLPNVILSPFGGLLADRYDRRLLMIIGDSFSGLGLLYILWNIHTGSQNLAPIFAGLIFNSVFTSLLEPAYKATVTDMLSEDEYDKASGLIQLASNSKYLIAPALAGVILSVWNIEIILLIDIMTFIITCCIIFSVKKYTKKLKPDFSKNFYSQMKEGLSVIIENKAVFSLIHVMFFVCFFLGIVQVLIRPFILSFSNIKAAGIIESVCAFGMIAGSAWIGFKGIEKGYVRTLSAAGILCGIFMSLSGTGKSLYTTGLFIFLFFTALPFMNTCADVLVRVSIPDEFQGRVWGIIGFITQMGIIAAFSVAGFLSDSVFEPMLRHDGILSGSVGKLVGTGKGSGIGLLLVLSGLGFSIMSLVLGKNREIRSIEMEKDIHRKQ